MTRSEFTALSARRIGLFLSLTAAGADAAPLRELLDLHGKLERVTTRRDPETVAREVLAPFNPAKALGAEAVQA